MPLFEYQCRDCGTKFEKLVTSSAAEVVCKNCDDRRIDKLLSVFSVAGSSRSTASFEPGPCGVCGARQRGMCGE